MNQIKTLKLWTLGVTLGLAQAVGVLGQQTPEHSSSNVSDLARALESAKDPFADPQYLAWADLFRSGDIAEVISQTEANLAQATPNPLAAYVWAAAQWRANALTETRQPNAERPLSDAQIWASETVVAQRTHNQNRLLALTESLLQSDATPFVATQAVAAANCQRGRAQECRALGRKLLLAYPQSFAAGRLAGRGGWNVPGDPGLKDLLSEDPALAASPAGAYALWLLGPEPRAFHEHRIAFDLWDDALSVGVIVAQRRGSTYLAQGNLEAARADFERAVQADPFSPDPALELARVLIASWEIEEAREAISSWVAIAEPEATRARQEAIFYAQALLAQGEKGPADRVTAAARVDFPDDPIVAWLRGRALASMKRNAEAAPFLMQGFQAMPDKVGVAADAAQNRAALEDHQGVLDIYAQHRDAGGPGDAALLNRARHAAHSLGDFRLTLQLYDEAKTRFPTVHWVIGNFAWNFHAAGAQDRAWDAVRERIEAGHDSRWILARTKDYQQAPGQALALLEQTVARSPHCERCWDALAQLPETQPKLVWQRAIDANPGWAFPWENLARVEMAAQGTWAAAEAVLVEAESAMSRANAPGWQMTALAEAEATLAAEAAEDQALAGRQAALDFGLTALATLRAEDVGAKTLFDLTYRLQRFVGASEVLSQSAMELARLEGDTWSRFNVIFRNSEVARGIGQSTKFRIMDRMLDRSPQHADWVREVARFHTNWGGSPLAALALLDRASAVDPDLPIQTQIEDANAKLGTHREHYRNRYENSASIAQSRRFVRWMDEARDRARTSDRTIKQLDLPRGRILWVGPEGIEEERRDDMLTGQVTYYRLGAMEVHLDRDARGNITQLRYGDGRFIRIGYSPPKDWFDSGLLVEVQTSDGERVRFDYDPDLNKPIRFRIVGLGHVEVAYDDTGTITGTQAFDAQGREASGDLASRISQSIQTLMRRLNEIRRLDARSVSQWDSYPEAPTIAAFRDRFDRSTSLGAQDFVDFAAVLVDKVEDRFGYAGEAEELLQDVMAAVREWDTNQDATEADYIAAAEAMLYWHRLQHRVRPGGIPAKDLSLWLEQIEWLNALTPTPALTEARARLKAAMASAPLRALSGENWLTKTDLDNPGFWKTHARSVIIPPEIADLTDLRDIALWNGAPVVVSGRGVGVFDRGHWQWFTVDPETLSLSATRDLAEADRHSDFAAALSVGDSLWLAGRGGVLVAHSLQDARLIETGALGSVALAQGGDGARGYVAAGGADGLYLITAASDATARQISSRPVAGLRPFPGGWIVLGPTGSWFQPLEGAPIELTDFQVSDALYFEAEDRLYALRGNDLIRTDAQAVKAGQAAWALMPGQEAISATDAPGAVIAMDIPGTGPALGVLTDQGVSFFQSGIIDHLTLPGGDRRPAALAADHQDTTFAVLTPRGVMVHLRDQAVRLSEDRVYDMVSDGELGVTYVAFGDRIAAYDHGNPTAGDDRFVQVAARHLALSASGDVITHSGSQILRFARGTTRREFLFDASPLGGTSPGGIEDIHTAKDGSVWVSAAGSLFRWQAGEVEEFSIYAETPAPFNSGWLSTIFESPEGEIMVVASNEGHLTHNGQKLTGGLFRLTDGAFKRVPEDEVLGNWFVTSATKLSDGSAILGTTGGFARMRDGRIEEFDLTEDASYKAIRELQPALYLGTKGAKLGQNLHLFGSAGGVVALHEGTWFLPDRINQMLPGRDFADYGSRAIHAIETDSKGRIYVGTDWGLTLFDPRGAGPEHFLITESRGDFAFSALERTKMQGVNDVLLAALPEGSEAGRLAKQFRAARAQLAELENRLQQGLASEANTDDLDRQLVRLRQRDIALLSRIEQANPSLFNMLALNPLDLQGLAKDLPASMVIAQYLPTDTRLFINLVGRDLSHVIEVDISAADLEARVRSAVALLRAQSHEALRGGFVLDPEEEAPDQTAAEAQLTQTLAALYRDLLAPLETLVADDATLVISPTAGLNYLPFGALVREIDGARPSYAVEHFDIAVAPTLYFLQQMLDKPPSIGLSHVVYGDPDGTLPGAREEARQVAETLAPDFVELRIGEEATYETLRDTAADARFLHLAMHGKLDPEAPANSYLLLADNHQMTLPEIMTLPLAEAELVFLSACETAMGPDGVEIRTLAHAFAHAGAPSVLATLWAVNDTAMQALSTDFYDAMLAGQTRAQALRSAQIAALERGGAYAQPGHWSGLILLGQP